MTQPRLGLLLAQSHILSALATGSVLHGSPGELMRQLDVAPAVFRAALQDLADGGWIYVAMARDGQLTIGRERRVRDDGPPGSCDRRGAHSLWEGLTAPTGW